jgi:hypothetical protein
MAASGQPGLDAVIAGSVQEAPAAVRDGKQMFDQNESLSWRSTRSPICAPAMGSSSRHAGPEAGER